MHSITLMFKKPKIIDYILQNNENRYFGVERPYGRLQEEEEEEEEKEEEEKEDGGGGGKIMLRLLIYLLIFIHFFCLLHLALSLVPLMHVYTTSKYAIIGFTREVAVSNNNLFSFFVQIAI